MEYWFIEEGFFAPYLVARSSGERTDVKVSAEKLHEIRANADKWAQSGYARDNLSVVGGVANISVSGVLLSGASRIDELYAYYFGETYTTYPGLIAQVRAAEEDGRVEQINFIFDTPGGMMAGVDEAARVMAGCKKKTKAVIPWMAASAGYYLASQCKEIVATAPSSSVGSIGVVVDLVDLSGMYEKWGVKFYSLTSTKAPKKRQEPHSEEFKKEIVSRLDALHAVFAQRVAEGRSRATGKTFTEEDVNEQFGRGGLVIAREALQVGMIDAVENEALNPETKEKIMGAEDKAAFTQEQLDAARAEGAQKERARVTSLLPFMDADSERVTAAIKDGSELTGELHAALLTAVVAKAKEEGKAAGAAEVAQSEAAAAQAREEEAVPEVTGKESEAASETDNASELATLREGALKMSKIKPKKEND